MSKPLDKNPYHIVKVAVPCPLHQCFDYRWNLDAAPSPKPGMRAAVPFGPRKLIGYILETAPASELPSPEAVDKLKDIIELYDEPLLFSDKLQQLIKWCAFYYCHPIGECAKSAAPVSLRTAGVKRITRARKWSITDKDFIPSASAHQQRKALSILSDSGGSIFESDLLDSGISRPTLKSLQKKKVIDALDIDPLLQTEPAEFQVDEISLNPEQTEAVETFQPLHQNFKVGLLQGVTGAGKTEVYIELVKQCLASGKQALVLVPEINLTPQTVSRFRKQLGVLVCALHSALSSKDKLTIQRRMQFGTAPVLIGTRSSVFSPFKSLGLIIVDEEHDSSYKQADGFKYSARDVAIKRAQIENIGVLLGTATPSLETMRNAKDGRYLHARLKHRARSQQYPKTKLIDIRSMPLQHGLSLPLIGHIREQLEAQNQVLIFQNRRGFAPALICKSCGWMSTCNNCDARLTVHLNPTVMRCHHCNVSKPLLRTCESCGSEDLFTTGAGTERIELGLSQTFPDTKILRFDRDNITSHEQLQNQLDIVNTGEPCILVGTQMLTKGHDFSKVTLVAVVDADNSFFSGDFRALEKGAQQLIQVAGRTGRGDREGQVYIQTRMGDHPAFKHIQSGNYEVLAMEELSSRAHCKLPPYSRMITIKAESQNPELPKTVLETIKTQLAATFSDDPQLNIAGPLDAAITRKAGVTRSYIHLFSEEEPLFRKLLRYLPALCKVHSGHKIRVSPDVDPSDYI